LWGGRLYILALDIYGGRGRDSRRITIGGRIITATPAIIRTAPTPTIIRTTPAPTITPVITQPITQA
jgi:hypothetical protein